jgi:hypothetical protein
LAEVRAELSVETLSDFIRQVLQSQVGKVVERHQLGLPLGPQSARIQSISRTADPTIAIKVKGEVDGGAVVEFMARTDMTLRLIVEDSAPRRRDDVEQATMGGKALVHRTHSIEVTGLITVDAYHRPTNAEITSVSALSTPVEGHLKDLFKTTVRSHPTFQRVDLLDPDPLRRQPETGNLPQRVGRPDEPAAMDPFEKTVASMPVSDLRAVVAKLYRSLAETTLIDQGWSPPDGWEPVLGPTQAG